VSYTNNALNIKRKNDRHQQRKGPDQVQVIYYYKLPCSFSEREISYARSAFPFHLKEDGLSTSKDDKASSITKLGPWVQPAPQRISSNDQMRNV